MEQYLIQPAQCIDFKEGIRPYFNELLVRCHKITIKYTYGLLVVEVTQYVYLML